MKVFDLECNRTEKELLKDDTLSLSILGRRLSEYGLQLSNTMTQRSNTFTSTQSLRQKRFQNTEYKFQHFSSLQIETHSISNLREITEEITEEIYRRDL